MHGKIQHEYHMTIENKNLLRMKKHSLLKSLLSFISLAIFVNLSAQITFQGVTDSTAIIDEDFTANVLYTIVGGTTPTFSLPLKPTGMNINSSGVITYHPNLITDGGRVIVRAVNSIGTYEMHFNVYVSDEITCSPDLISYHQLNESGGTTFADYQGGPDATSATALSAASGRVDGAVLLSPSTIGTEFMTIPDNDQYEWSVNDDFSFAIWIYPLGKPAFSQNMPDDQVLFYSENTSTGALIIFGLDGQDVVTDVLKPKIRLINSAGDPEIKITSSSEVTPNAWHHMAFAYDAMGGGVYNLRIYLDGSKIENPFNAFTSSANFYLNKPMYIGWYDYTGYTVPFNGRMDEILIYNKALSDAEVLGIYNDGLAGEAHCKPGNHAPEFINNFPSSILQGGSYNVQLATYDIEGDPVAINATSIPDWMSYNSTNKRLTNKANRPDNSDVGSHNVTVTANDGHVMVTRTFPITVENVNDPPTFTSSHGNTTMDEDTHFSYSITYEDIDVGDVVTLTAPVKPNWLTLNTVSNILSGIPTNDTLGTDASKVFNVTLRLDDGEATVDQSFTITVNNVNDPPVITGQNDIYTDEHTPITITPAVAFTSGVNITDVDDVFPTDFTLTVSDSVNYSVTPPNTVNPDEFFSGTLAVPIVLSDGQANVPYTLFVNVNFVNEIPDITSTPDRYVNEYEFYEYTLVATDGDPGDVLVFNDSIVPHWLTFVPETGYLSGTPRYFDVCDTFVILTVSDGHITVNHEFELTVLDHNYAPEITSIPEEEWHVGEVYQYNLTATDLNEDDNLTFTAIEKPDWLNFETQETQALLHGYPTEENVGEFDIMLQVSDGESIDQQSYTLVISIAGIEDRGEGAVLVYPIPANNKVFFDYTGIISGTIIEIVNLNGSVLASEIVSENTGKAEFDLTGFNPGLYLYRIIENDQITTGKLIVE
jgi:hypothetical protein